MEKKTKKLQLRKETIAVLNGERMAHVVGGLGYCEPPYVIIEENGVQVCSIVATVYCDDNTDAIVDETIVECLEGFTRKAKTNGNGYCCHIS